jgi:murein DD-endopeptidase MepM/ murein hydrolase activator NlpD
MYYPFLLYSDKVDLRPVFKALPGDPYVADLSPASALLEGLDARDQTGLQRRLDAEMGRRYRWGVAPYLEHRDTLLGKCPQMVAEQRFIHLGLDVIVALGTALHAPLDATVADSGYEPGQGNYGGYVLLQHASVHFDTFYSFYGHLCKARLPTAGQFVAAGAPFAEIGDFHENGNWFHHTHIQVITSQGLQQGYLSKGYCARADLAEMNDLCPSPIALFRRG